MSNIESPQLLYIDKINEVCKAAYKKTTDFVLAIEFCYQIENNNGTSKTFVDGYCDMQSYYPIVKDFIDRFGSLLQLSFNEDEFYSSLSSLSKKNIENTEKKFSKYEFLSNKEKLQSNSNSEYFSLWNKYLSEKNYGKYSILLALKPQYYLNRNFAVFLILNDDITEKQDILLPKIFSIIKTYLIKYTFGYSLEHQKRLEVELEELQEARQTAENEKFRLEKERREIKAHKHSIRNFPFKLAVDTLAAKLKANNIYHQYEEDIDKINKIEEIRDIVIDFMYRADTNEETLLQTGRKYETKKYETLTEMLELLHKSHTVKSKTPIVNIDPSVRNNSFNAIKPQQFRPVFTLLLNLWTNALNHARSDTFNIDVSTQGKFIELCFKNKGTMPENWRSFFSDMTDTTEAPKPNKGLCYVKDCLLELGWTWHIKLENNHTIITLITNQ